jgi:ATP-dependent Clp protease, protease subunit
MFEQISANVERELYLRRIIRFHNEINAKSMTELKNKILLLDMVEQQPITIFFSSEGGDIVEALSFYDFIKNINSEINIHVESQALSAGLFIIACCATGTRSCGKNSTFLYHPTSAEQEGIVSDILSDTKELQRVCRVTNNILAKHTALTTKGISDMFSHDVWFTPANALEWGMIDEIR